MADFIKEVAIVCITVIVCVALYLGIDGALYGAAIAAIAGIAGFTIAKGMGERVQGEREGE